MSDLVREITDDFVSAFDDDRYDGAFARIIASGVMPEGVDASDPRVIDIVAKCRRAPFALPIPSASFEVVEGVVSEVSK